MTIATDTQARRGDWILTASGRHFWPIDPRADEVSLDDIATSLAHQCRWTGHVSRHYSIAQHACYVAEAVEAIAPSLALAALHHDSAEAYIGDISRPWKRMLRVQVGEFRQESVASAEMLILWAILEALHIRDPATIKDGWDIIMRADNAVLRAESIQLLPPDPSPGSERLGDPVPGLEITAWTPDAARRTFLALHDRLVREHGVTP